MEHFLYKVLLACHKTKMSFCKSGIKVPINVCYTVHKFMLVGLCCTSCSKIQFCVITVIDHIKHYCALVVCILLLDAVRWSLLQNI
jgi:hypothetical protein